MLLLLLLLLRKMFKIKMFCRNSLLATIESRPSSFIKHPITIKENAELLGNKINYLWA